MEKNKTAKGTLDLTGSSMAAGFDFTNVKNDHCGPENIFIVAKSDVFAHRLSEKDVKGIQNLSSREGSYDEEYKTAGNWLCTAEAGEEAGEFWIVKDRDFGKIYKTEMADDQTLTREVCGIILKFNHYAAAHLQTFACFRLPSNAPETMYLGEKKFVPGDYVFIKNNECEIWARSDIFMQQQYHLIEEKRVEPNDKIKEQYRRLLSGEKDEKAGEAPEY